MYKNIKAYAAKSSNDNLGPYKISRRDVGENDVLIDILFCGVCHTDIHYLRNDWGISVYPLVPGHEIVGKVIKKGNKVKNVKINDLVGVGVLVNSCQSCFSCKKDLEPYCETGATFTYNAPDKILGGRTFGGYSERIVVDKRFILKVPENLDIKSVAPLLCAGITTYSPLKKWSIKKGQKIGVIGLGGLGHIGVKFAKSMGANVLVITSSKDKVDDAKKLGASDVIISTNKRLMENHKNTFNFLLNTIPRAHDLSPFLDLLKIDSTMVIVGAIEKFEKVNMRSLIFGRKSVAGSLIGGIKETQEMLDYCSKHNIVCDTEIINIQEINEAFKRMQGSDVKYRFVIDMKSIKK